MDSKKKTARIAGILYLILVVSGMFHLMYVPSQLIVADNPSLTISNIIARETLFRLGILGGIICYTAFLLLPLALYKLLSPVNKTHAVLMVTLAAVSIPISFVNLLNKFSVLTLIGKAKYLSVFDAGQLQAQALLYLDYYSNGNQVASIFWGLWLFPFGYLVYKSGFLPKVFGILLMAGCFGYIIDFLGYFFFSNYSETVFSTFIGIPSSLGEIGICLWLLIIGVKTKSDTVTNNPVLQKIN
jgi:Domain of unknown function (DUF4386)